MNSFIADCRYAARRYARTPGSSLIAVVVLAIGIAFVGAFLSLYVDLALKPFPGIDDDGRLVTIYQFNGARSDRIPFGLTSRMSEELTSLEAVVGFNWWANLTVGTCFCVPWRHLEGFYGLGGFYRCEPQDAPPFLVQRHSQYVEKGMDVVLMVRA